MEIEMEMGMGKLDIGVIPQISLELHTARKMARQEIICTLVVYAANLPLVTKVFTQ